MARINIRVSINIGGVSIKDNEFSEVYLTQSISAHHNLEIRMRQDAIQGTLADKVKAWIGQPVSVGFDFQKESLVDIAPLPDSFKGIVTSMGLSRRSGTAELIVRGQSPTILFDDGPNTRSFTNKGLQEIVDKVLSPYTSKFKGKLDVEPATFTKVLPYCVQYKESNFGFVKRLADRYGEWFYYDGLNLNFGKSSDDKPITLDFGENGLIGFDMSVQAIPPKFEMKAYDYEQHKPLEEEAPLSSANSEIGKEVIKISKNEIYPETPSIPVNVAIDKNELKNLTERREQVAMDEVILVEGASHNPNLKIGAKITISDKIIGEKFGTYTITSLTHTIVQGGAYDNEFEAIPSEVKTPPLNSIPTPPFCETQLAKVTAVDDEDGLGRVKVKFIWQEGGSETSPWIRVASPYTGKDKGFYIIPEVDDQVLVGFESNSPDKPYVLTGMYNGDAKPEWFDTKNHFKGFKSKGKNEWKFDDKNKSISIHAPSSIMMSAGKKITIKTGGKEDSEINIDVGDGTVNVTAKVVNVTAAETIALKSDKEVTVTAAQKIQMDSSKEYLASGTQKVEIKGTQVKVEATAKAEVKGAMVDVSGSGPVNVKGLPIKLN